MNSNHKTAVIKGNNHESKMKITTSRLIRWAGLSAMMAGILFIVIQTIHPADILSSVTTGRWAIVHYLSIAMCLLGLLGIAGIYARQLEEAGWLGWPAISCLASSMHSQWAFNSPKPLSRRCCRPSHQSLWKASWRSPVGPPVR